jgi:hypothetical protein
MNLITTVRVPPYAYDTSGHKHGTLTPVFPVNNNQVRNENKENKEKAANLLPRVRITSFGAIICNIIPRNGSIVTQSA